MAVLVDTCVLLRAFDTMSPQYRDVRRCLRKLIDDNERIVIGVQNVAEFWNVCTRPLNQNGQGCDAARAAQRVRLIEQVCEVLAEDIRSFESWKQLCERHAVSGVAVHDARLISVMLTRQIDRILTLNERDFRRYEPEGIVIVTPQSVLG